MLVAVAAAEEDAAGEREGGAVGKRDGDKMSDSLIYLLNKGTRPRACYLFIYNDL